jgi:hypothetical protein
MEIGGIPAFPFFHHAGKSLSSPEKCVCSTLTTQELSERTHPCHAFRFISGFYYWPTMQDIAPILEVTSKYLSISRFHDAGFQAAFYSSSFGQAPKTSMPFPGLNVSSSSSSSSSASQGSLLSKSEQEARIAKAFKFCASQTYGNCSIFTLSSYDLYDRGSTINEYYFQLERGACRDSFTPNTTAW